MKHITITVKSELEDIEPYLKDILTTMKNHDEVIGFSIKTSTFTERPEIEHSNNKSISNHEAAEILKLMPKQSDAIKKAIEVLESENYYKSLAESYGNTINKLTMAISESNKWISVSERLPKERTAVLVWCPERKNIYCACHENKQWWIFGAYFQKIELDVKAWMPLPEPYKVESEDKE